MATMTAGTARTGMTAERRFFTTMACVVLAATFIGFAPSYYLRPVMHGGTRAWPLTVAIHLHAAAFTAWVMLYVVQTGLVAAARVDLHRRLGMAGVALIAAMIPLGLVVAVQGIDRPFSAPPGMPPLMWSAVPILSIPVFGGLVIAALVKRRQPATHKRLMLIAMVALLQPSLGRLLPMLGVGGPAVLLAPLPFLLPLFWWDVTTRGRPAATTWAGSLIVAAQILLTPMIWGSAAWTGFAAALHRLIA